MRNTSRFRTISFFLALFVFCPVYLRAEWAVGLADSSYLRYHAATESKRFLKLPSFRRLIISLIYGDNPLFESLVRPLEFREPIVAIPAEGRYGWGFYGAKGFNPFRFDSKLISYESDTVAVLQNNSITGRFGHSMEFDLMQTNLSHLLFKKSYIDLVTGLGFRYSSIFLIPNLQVSDTTRLVGPPELPSSWPVSNKTFTPTVLEGNIGTSLILQWHPKWFLQLKYSYGLNRVRFYRNDSLNDLPLGKGRASTYSVGVKFIKESETAARYAIGLELKHTYLKVSRIEDPNDITPISGFKFPQFGLYFTISAFYGGHPTVGDEAKKLYLNNDYVSAKRKFLKFIESYPHHAKRRRAEKLIEICDERIPYQLFGEGDHLEKTFQIDLALEKYVEATHLANESLKKILDRRIETIAEDYLNHADSLFIIGEIDEALRFARKAAAVSEKAREALTVLEARVAIRRGEDLAFRGLYSRALEKYGEALKLAPFLKHDVRRHELKVAAGLLEDVNKANDEATVRLALLSLYKAREVLGKSDEKMDKMIEELERQLSIVQGYRVRQTMDAYLAEARARIAERYQPKVELGMLVSEVQDIWGEPDEVTQMTGDKNKNYQMWIYRLPDKKKKFLYFEDYTLFKIENE